MRLIDADNINFHCNYDGDCTGDIDDCKECGNYICDFRDIQEQPTAYDIDKVVEELEERKALHERLVDYENKNGTVTEKYQHIKAIDVLSDAIEIVKKGIRKDVSE